MVKNPPQCRRPRDVGFDPWVRKIPGRQKWKPTLLFILAWKIPWTEEPGGLQSLGSQRVVHDSMHTHTHTHTHTHSTGTFVVMNGPILIHYYLLTSRLESDSLSFYLMSFFRSRIPSRIAH